MNWVLLPFRNCWALTEAAAGDVLAQTLPHTCLLLIDNGGSAETRAACERFVAQHNDRVSSWHWTPAFPSLAACWNRALQFVWATGANHALVVNNDVRLHPRTYDALLTAQDISGAWFVTAVGVTAEGFGATDWDTVWPGAYQSRGGPDFSCYLITKACHDAYPFDEHFIPAYCEDLDYHRRLLLDGHGDRIFSVNLPFLHYASGTLKGMPQDQRDRLEDQITAGSRAYYVAKWGGGVNQERYARPFDPTSDQEGVTTPELQHGQETV